MCYLFPSQIIILIMYILRLPWGPTKPKTNITFHPLNLRCVWLGSSCSPWTDFSANRVLLMRRNVVEPILVYLIVMRSWKDVNNQKEHVLFDHEKFIQLSSKRKKEEIKTKPCHYMTNYEWRKNITSGQIEKRQWIVIQRSSRKKDHVHVIIVIILFILLIRSFQETFGVV